MFSIISIREPKSRKHVANGNCDVCGAHRKWNPTAQTTVPVSSSHNCQHSFYLCSVAPSSHWQAFAVYDGVFFYDCILVNDDGVRWVTIPFPIRICGNKKNPANDRQQAASMLVEWLHQCSRCLTMFQSHLKGNSFLKVEIFSADKFPSDRTLMDVAIFPRLFRLPNFAHTCTVFEIGVRAIK